MKRPHFPRALVAQALKLCTTPSTIAADGEKKLFSILKTHFPGAKEVTVTDISGGCGAMYDISVESLEFKGKNRVQQHRMITEALKNEIKDMHGIRIHTAVPNS